VALAYRLPAAPLSLGGPCLRTCSLWHSSPARCGPRPRWICHHRLAARVLGLGGGPGVLACPLQLGRAPTALASSPARYGTQLRWLSYPRLAAVALNLGPLGITAWPLRYSASVALASPPSWPFWYSASVVALAPSSAHGSSVGLKGLGLISCPLGHPASVALASSPGRRGTRPLW
jgi:hypothetical protein